MIIKQIKTTKMKLLYTTLLLMILTVNFGYAQVLCEECEECEGEAEGEGEAEAEAEADYTFEIGEAEGTEELTFEEADLLGEVAGEVAGEAAEEIGVEVALDVVMGMAALDEIPVVGEVLAVVEVLALVGIGLYELFSSVDDEFKQEHELALAKARAGK